MTTDQIIRAALTNGNVSSAPVAVVMMGGPGSGKSSVVSGLSIDGFVSVDPDWVKSMMPRYQELVSAGNPDAAAICHADSSSIAIAIRDAAIAARFDVLIDGTGKDITKMISTVEALHAANYTVQLVFVDVSVETGLSRAQSRAARTGRVVPESIIRSAYAAIPKNFETLVPMVDSASRFDNNGASAVLVFSTDSVALAA